MTLFICIFGYGYGYDHGDLSYRIMLGLVPFFPYLSLIYAAIYVYMYKQSECNASIDGWDFFVVLVLCVCG